MLRRHIVLLLAMLIVLPGCSLHDALFGMFGSYYSGGGESRQDRKADYDAQVDAYKRNMEMQREHSQEPRWTAH